MKGGWLTAYVIYIVSELWTIFRTITDILAALKKYQSRSRFSKAINRGLDQLNKRDRRLDELNTQLILVRVCY